MILIISKSELEATTDQVIDWLDAFDCDYYRLNGEDFIENAEIVNGQLELDNFNPEAISIIWNRRWSNKSLINRKNEGYYDALGAKNASILLRSLRQERGILRLFLMSKLSHKVWTTHPGKLSPNKIVNLEIAKSCNLLAPEYIITSSKLKLLQFAKKHQKVITKPISETPFFSSLVEGNIVESLILYTKSFSVDQIEKEVPNTFFKSLFQQQIIKEFEIRVFYFNDTCYSMAIFSQNDTQTEVDFRNYNNDKPNRTVPFILPKEVERNVRKFCKEAGYKIGSLDLIKSTDGKYYFLEINPVGQFGMVSHPCNYHLEKKLAKFLVDENKKIKHKRSTEAIH